MNPCDAFKWATAWARCADCGTPYWVHSHEYVRTGGYHQRGRIRHRIITREQAFDKYNLHASGATRAPDLRPRYQIMQERRTNISKFYLTAAQLHLHRDQAAGRRHLQKRWS
jgi:hypothetical protein